LRRRNDSPDARCFLVRRNERDSTNAESGHGASIAAVMHSHE
jgi:hypothetical protein